MFRPCGFAPFLIFTVQPCFGFFHALPFLGQILIDKVVADAAEAIHDGFGDLFFFCTSFDLAMIVPPLLYPFDCRDLADEQHDAHNTDDDACGHAVPDHRHAHADAKDKRADDAQQHRTDRSGTQLDDDRLAFQLAAHQQHDEQYDEPDH